MAINNGVRDTLYTCIFYLVPFRMLLLLACIVELAAKPQQAREMRLLVRRLLNMVCLCIAALVARNQILETLEKKCNL